MNIKGLKVRVFYVMVVCVVSMVELLADLDVTQ
jgi:hypothetical protein